MTGSRRGWRGDRGLGRLLRLGRREDSSLPAADDSALGDEDGGVDDAGSDGGRGLLGALGVLGAVLVLS